MGDDAGSASGAGPRHAAVKGEHVEAVDIAIAVLVVALIFWLLTRGINAAQRAGKAVKRAREPTPRVRPKYDFEPVTDRLARSKPALDARDQQTVRDWLNTPGTVFVSHTSATEVFPGVNGRLDQVAVSAGFRKESLGIFCDSHGRPIYEVFRYFFH